MSNSHQIRVYCPSLQFFMFYMISLNIQMLVLICLSLPAGGLLQDAFL